jgi:hypothetical protein
MRTMVGDIEKQEQMQIGVSKDGQLSLMMLEKANSWSSLYIYDGAPDHPELRKRRRPELQKQQYFVLAFSCAAKPPSPPKTAFMRRPNLEFYDFAYFAAAQQQQHRTTRQLTLATASTISITKMGLHREARTRDEGVRRWLSFMPPAGGGRGKVGIDD